MLYFTLLYSVRIGADRPDDVNLYEGAGLRRHCPTIAEMARLTGLTCGIARTYSRALQSTTPADVHHYVGVGLDHTGVGIDHTEVGIDHTDMARLTGLTCLTGLTYRTARIYSRALDALLVVCVR